MDAIGSIDQLIDTLRDRGMSMPRADLLLGDVYDTLSGDIIEAKHVGRGVIGGVECEHLAFRNQDVDWQLWVQPGDKPIPCKYVITSKAVGMAPEYTLLIRNWKTDVPVDETAAGGGKKGGSKCLGRS